MSDIRSEVRGRKPEAGHPRPPTPTFALWRTGHPATSHQPPTTSHQPPATSHQPPATSIVTRAASLALLLTTCAAAAPEQAGFTWPWEADAGTRSNLLRRAAETDDKTPFAAFAREQNSGEVGVAPDAYGRVVRQNLDMRADLNAIRADYAKAKLANEDMARRIADLQKKREALAQLVTDMRRAETTDKERRIETLESRITDAGHENTRLRDELGRVKAKLNALSDERTDLSQRNTGLFRQIEKEKIEIQERMARMRAAHEAERKNREQAANEQIEAVRKTLKTNENTREKLTRRVAELGAQHDALNELLAQIKAALDAKDREIGELRESLRQSEQHLVRTKSELAAADQERDRLQTAFDREKRNMRYNMGVIQTERGQFEGAARSYSQALELDPRDADSHYNLGVLYDDFLKQHNKALHHYREFLRIKPDSADAEQVRSWIMNIERTPSISRPRIPSDPRRN